MRRIRRKKDRSKDSEARPGPDDADDGVSFDDLITRELGAPSVTEFGEDTTALADNEPLVGPRVDVTLEGSEAENARLRAELLNPPTPSAGPSAAATVAAARASVMAKASAPAPSGAEPVSPLESGPGETPMVEWAQVETPQVETVTTEPLATRLSVGSVTSHAPAATPQVDSAATAATIANTGAVLEPHDALIVPSDPEESPFASEAIHETAKPDLMQAERRVSGFSQTDFWDRYEEATAAAELFTVPPAAVTVVIGSLDVAIPIVERCQSNHWVSDCDVFVLSERDQVPTQPTWTMVRRPSEIVSVLENGESDFPLLVIDVPRELPAWIRPLIVRLRQGGVGLVHYVLGDDPSDEDLATWHGELGRPSVLDLAAPVGPDRVLELLDRGEPISSVAGMPISTELLLALRLNRG